MVKIMESTNEKIAKVACGISKLDIVERTEVHGEEVLIITDYLHMTDDEDTSIVRKLGKVQIVYRPYSNTGTYKKAIVVVTSDTQVVRSRSDTRISYSPQPHVEGSYCSKDNGFVANICFGNISTVADNLYKEDKVEFISLVLDLLQSCGDDVYVNKGNWDELKGTEMLEYDKAVKRKRKKKKGGVEVLRDEGVVLIPVEEKVVGSD